MYSPTGQLPFVGKYTLPIFFGIVGTFLLAFIVKDIQILEYIALLAIGIFVVVVTTKSLLNGLVIACTEIFVGGHGHLISTTLFDFSISLRMVIFVSVLGTWTIGYLTKKITPIFIKKRDRSFIPLLCAVTLGSILGLIYGQTIKTTFEDANSYLVLLYLLPIASIIWDDAHKKILLQTLTISVLTISVMTIGLSFFFTHASESVARTIYTIIRDLRLTEVTLQSISNSSGMIVQPQVAPLLGEQGYWYRIFMQSHLFVSVFLLLLFTFICADKVTKENRLFVSIAVILSTSALILSMSRSFFLGIGIAIIGITSIMIYTQRKKIYALTKNLSFAILLGTASCVLAWLTIIFPLPTRPPLENVLFYNTSVNETRDTAITSRWSLLTSMMEVIKERPILGSGFGTSITYITDDPRQRERNVDGIYTTHRFEWGYHDIWIKMGILGLIGFLYYLYSVTRQGLTLYQQKYSLWLYVGLIGSVYMLYITHIFSPYLNHPIGIMLILFVLPFLYPPQTKEEVLPIGKNT